MTIIDLIQSETAGHEANLAVIDGQRQITYRQLLSDLESLAAELEEAGLRPCQRVGLLCRDSLEYILISLAILHLKAALVPIPATLAMTEIQSLLSELEVNALIFENTLCPAEPADRPLRHDGLAIGMALRHLTVETGPPAAFDRLEPAFVRFSSGTTGHNKGVVISHTAIAARTDAAQAGLQISPADVILWVLDMSYHFVVTILLFLRKAATIVLCGRDFPLSLADQEAVRQGTFIYASPFHYNQLLQSRRFTRDHLPRVRLAVSTAMRQPVLEARKFYDKFGFELAEAYGIIEVGLPFINLSGDPAKRGSVGRMLPGYKITLADPDEEGVGRILLQGEGMFAAYYSPWKERRELLDNGWFDTGDIGRLDEDGFLFLAGRKKNVINFAGMKIFPEQVEEVLNQHPDVQQARVYGQAHDSFGELPLADIVTCDDRPVDIAQLRRFCYERLAVNKVPKKFQIVTELPRTPSGKLRRW